MFALPIHSVYQKVQSKLVDISPAEKAETTRKLYTAEDVASWITSSMDGWFKHSSAAFLVFSAVIDYVAEVGEKAGLSKEHQTIVIQVLHDKVWQL